MFGSTALKKMSGSIVIFAAVVALTACGHWAMRNEVAMKVSDRLAYVCMNDGEVDIGDEVILYETQCTMSSDADGTYECTATKLAEGVVTKVLNAHYSEVVVTQGGPFKEGTRVIRKNEFKDKYKALLKRVDSQHRFSNDNSEHHHK